MPLLFSYGSLQRAEVQRSTFGRELEGVRDELLGWRLVPPAPGQSLHANVIRAADMSRVTGTAFEITDAELRSADEYERRDRYVRVTGRLASGRDTWVYVDELSLGGRMEERNPYAAPKAPVIAGDEPTRLPGDPEEFEYGGFWRRVGAAVLDGIIMIPMGLLLFFLMYKTSQAYLYYLAPSIVVSLFYYVYLVKRFGGTPGKRIIGMRITMVDGSPVTTQAAVIRYAPFFLLQVLAILAAVKGQLTPVDNYDSLNFLEKMQTLQRGQSAWSGLITGLTYIWWIATAITLAANYRKRAAHDFMAGTVVLRTD